MASDGTISASRDRAGAATGAGSAAKP